MTQQESTILSLKSDRWDLEKDNKQAVRTDFGLIFFKGNELKRIVKDHKLKFTEKRVSESGLVRYYNLIRR